MTLLEQINLRVNFLLVAGEHHNVESLFSKLVTKLEPEALRATSDQSVTRAILFTVLGPQILLASAADNATSNELPDEPAQELPRTDNEDEDHQCLKPATGIVTTQNVDHALTLIYKMSGAK